MNMVMELKGNRHAWWQMGNHRIINYIEQNRNLTYDEYCTCNDIFTAWQLNGTRDKLEVSGTGSYNHR